ncbi:MAG: DUF4339 domain-containing protein [Lentisphaerota bacterium]
MEWYYSVGNKQVGPVDEKIMRQLIESGTVNRTTRVWREGMREWLLSSETELNLLFKTSVSDSGNTIGVKKTTKILPFKYMLIGGVIIFAVLCYIGGKYQRQRQYNYAPRHTETETNVNWRQKGAAEGRRIMEERKRRGW